MQPFSQSVVGVWGAPDTLHPTLFTSAKDFSQAVNSAITRVRDPPPILGIAILLTVEDAVLEGLAVATSADEIFILYSRSSPILGGIHAPAASVDALSPILHGQRATLVGFNMARIAMHVRHGLNSHVGGIEITEAASPKERRLSPGGFVKNYVDKNANTFAVDSIWDALPDDTGKDSGKLEHLALRAWLTARISCTIEIRQGLNQCISLDTVGLTSKYFKPIHQMLVEVEQMEAAKSRVQENNFKDTTVDGEGNIIITNDRFSNRVRASERTEVWMFDQADCLHRGTARRAKGKTTQVTPRSKLGDIPFKAIFVVGKDDFSHADHSREMFLLQLLQGRHQLHEPTYDLIQKLYFPNPREILPRKVSGALIMGRLNQSQADVVEAMANSESPFVIVHGPPGTGKTSTISAALQLWVQSHGAVWVVAQSNVAVKNIAERLSKDAVPFKLLVSKEFYHEWHEDIYDDQVKESLVRTDELPANIQDVSILFHQDKNVFSFVPVINLVVDEASQIGIFNLMHVFAKFKRLSKVCFFGDPKQLPPFGKDAAPTLQSVFDVRHLKPQSYFLNTQYRLPIPLGSFISDAVYDGKLRSQHKIAEYSCVGFIDVSFGEEENDKKSYINKREVQTVEHLVRDYYQLKDYCVITPYDAQRNLLQKTLKDAGLRYDNIYNVDSFQGNEADYIIVSVVRSKFPGFLTSKNRVNVMLTRCRLGMVIVTSRAFMQQRIVKDTLLGAMLQRWESMHGQDATWREWKSVAERKADLPGINFNRGRADPFIGESFSSDPRSSSRTLSLAANGIHRSSMALAPKGALMPNTTPFQLIPDDSPQKWVSNLSPGSRLEPKIDPVIENLHRMRLETGYRRRLPLEPLSESSQSSPSKEQYHSPGESQHSNHTSAFPGLPSSSRLQATASGAWRIGPPISSRLPSSNLSPASLPSQKLTALKKNVPSVSASQNQKKNKRWEKLVLF